MDELLELSDKLINQVSMGFSRYLMSEIDWDKRLIGIKGARGTGKTTLLLQWLRSSKLKSRQAVYFSLDELYFTSHNIVETGSEFYKKGGKVIVLDEVHKYNNWSQEIKILYDRYPDLKILFTGSSIIDISKQEGDLSRRAIVYELFGLSYREYLQMIGYSNLNILTLNEIIDNKSRLRSVFPPDFRPLEHFSSYLLHGYYPFSKEDIKGYHQRLRQLVRQIVEYDMAELKGFDIRNAKKMLQLISIVAQQVPFKPNFKKLAEKSQIHRNSISNYLFFLEKARLINLLLPSGNSIAGLQKPEKIFINNTNLLYSLAFEKPEKGSLRETFVFSQLMVKHQVNHPKNGDFEVDNKYIFEVGGAGKSVRQIINIDNAFVIKDDLEFPTSNSIPMWLLGFLY